MNLLDLLPAAWRDGAASRTSTRPATAALGAFVAAEYAAGTGLPAAGRPVRRVPALPARGVPGC